METPSFVSRLHAKYSYWKWHYYEVRRTTRPDLPSWDEFVGAWHFDATRSPGWAVQLGDFYGALGDLGIRVAPFDAFKRFYVRHDIASWSVVDERGDFQYLNDKLLVKPFRAMNYLPPALRLDSTLAVYMPLPLDELIDASSRKHSMLRLLYHEQMIGAGFSEADVAGRVEQRIRQAGFFQGFQLSHVFGASVDPEGSTVLRFYVGDSRQIRQRLDRRLAALAPEEPHFHYEPVAALYRAGTNDLVEFNDCAEVVARAGSVPDEGVAEMSERVRTYFRRRKLRLLANA